MQHGISAAMVWADPNPPKLPGPCVGQPMRVKSPSILHAADPGPWQGGFDVSSAAVIATPCASASQLT